MSAVRVELRQTTLTESARLREANDQVFLCIENPPPVRSLLRLTIDAEQKAFEVGQVVEVVGEEEPERGCYGAFIELARLDEHLKVGSEHLQPASSGGGVPAPVVMMNTNEMMLGEAGSEADEAEAAGASEHSSGESADEGTGDADCSADGGDSADEGSGDEPTGDEEAASEEG